MYLSNLEIYGFKSFAQRTKFEFSNGLCALVGPNGCGKTNIVDAIRWVLGEQKTSILRSDVMENVIFNGTKSRKPLSMAEVTLTLQNNRRILPIEYEEVNVTRRLFRNGESQYFLNKAKCRLRDIVDLFMDTGMGFDSYSVIELKMVEAILSGKPDERRHLFEEAAGVGKYKLRRKEATRKLESVETDLIRLEDIVAEVEKNVNSLSRQAAKTKRYNKLLEELNAIELEHLKHEFVLYRNKRESIDAEISKQNEKIKSIENEIEVLNEDYIKLNGNRITLEEEYKKAKHNEAEITGMISEKKEEIAVSNEKMNNLESRESRLRNELKEAEELQKNIIQQIEERREQNAQLLNILEEATGITGERKRIYNDSTGQLKAIRDKANQSNEKVLGLQSRLDSLNELITRNLSRRVNLEQMISETESLKNSLLSQIDLIEAEIQESIAKQKELDKRFAGAEKRLNSALNEKTELQNEIDKIRQELVDKKTYLSQQTAALDFLNNLVEASEATEYLMKSDYWKPRGGKSLLGELIGVDDKYRVAISAALEDMAEYFVVENYSDALKGIEELSENQKGRATFICLDRVEDNYRFNVTELRDYEIGWISEIVRVEKPIRNILRAIVGNTILVKDIDTALESIKRKEVLRAVTLSGEILDKRGLIKGGSISKDEGISIGKKERISELMDTIRRLQKEIMTIEEELSVLIAKNEEIDIRSLSDELKQADTDRVLNEQNISKLQSQRMILSDNLALYDSSIERYKSEILEYDKENIDSEKLMIESELEESKKIYTDILEQLTEADKINTEAQEDYRVAEMNYIKLEGELKNLAIEISSLENQLLFQKETAESRQEQIEYNINERIALGERIKNLSSEVEELKRRSNEATARCDLLSEQLESIQEQLGQGLNDLNERRKAHEREIQSLHQIDLRLNEINMQLENLNSRAKERFEVNLYAEDIVIDESFDVETSRQRVNELRVKLATLGSVNFLALEEFEKESERLNFYSKQVKDLKDSKKTLEETITEINQTAEEKFLSTFVNITNNFKKLFVNLFTTDAEADLRLAEGNPLEADIEIVAKPPGKKPHSIEMISSGEKTLTAIALLFAIYLVKPSPFCILDEVDAPLDDANIDRFINLIREFSKDTQFIIVTHNKRTMEAADTLYGITMQEDGISKVVSARLTRVSNNEKISV